MTQRYIITPTNAYTGDLTVYGPYDTEQERDDAAKLLLFDERADTRLYYMDILPPTGRTHTWRLSESYTDDLRRAWQQANDTPS